MVYFYQLFLNRDDVILKLYTSLCQKAKCTLEHCTHEERAPIIDGLGRAPPRPRAAGQLITVNNSIS